MGFRLQLFGSNPDLVSLSGDGSFALEVVAESRLQVEPGRLSGHRRPEGFDEEFAVILVPEPNNPHDSDAVRVEIGGVTVGHLHRDDAAAYRRRLGDRSATCRARVRGSWDRGEGDAGDFGIWLDATLG